MFARSDKNGIVRWRASPCQDGHDFVLAKLQPYSAQFWTNASSISWRVKGNLGEFSSFWIGVELEYADEIILKPANAYDPLADISRPGVDILWMHFDSSDETKDFVFLQEVKTTASTSLNYASRLVDDYEKLFGPDPDYQLQTRLIAAKTELEFTVQRPDLVDRVTRLAGVSPASSPRVRLIPTLVHDEAADPEAKLLAVRGSILSLGWQADQVTPWSIALDILETRLVRLAMGKP